jgi:hypothetical protein
MPIFQEPPPTIDETWTHGAMLGGMCGYDEQQMAESYFAAGDSLISAVLDGQRDGRHMINPVMYVYRHGVELYLKCIVRPSVRDHNLASLLERFCRHVRARYREPIPRWVTKPISELAAYDPGSDTFRYDTDRDGRYFQTDGESWVDLRTVRKEMSRLLFAFRRVWTADQAGEILPVILRRPIETFDDVPG